MSSDGDVKIVVQNVEKTFVSRNKARRGLYRKKQIVHAIKGVSFAVRSGESLGIMGQNGSGKSTLLRIIAGGENPTSGRVLVSSEPTLLGVSAALQPHLSGAKNVELGLLAMGILPKQLPDYVEQIVEFTGLGDDIWRPMADYSSGMSARLKFAISTAQDPDLLLIDEALATGDASFSHRAQSKTEELLAHSGSVILVSHNGSQVRDMCERAIWLHNGEIVADGPSDEVAPAYAKWAQRMGRNDVSGASSLLTETKEGYDEPRILVTP